MFAIEYGKENKEVIIFLHGGGLSWWNFREEAELLQNRFHVILPVLDGHADSDKSFESIESNSKDLISYIDEFHKGSVLLIGGLSLGAQILVEMMSQREDICKYAIIESALIIPMKFTKSLIKPMIGISYSLIKKKWFSKLQFQSLKMKESLYDDYYRDTCKISKHNLISLLLANLDYSFKDTLKCSKAKVGIFVGGKEQHKMIESAKTLHELLKSSTLKILDGSYHGEFSINNSTEYVEACQP